MKKLKKIIILSFFTVLCSNSCDSSENKFVQLDDNNFFIDNIIGSYTAGKPYKFNIPVDLGVKFNSISNVSILIQGIASPGLATLHETNQNYVMPVDFNIYMAEVFEPQIFSIQTPVAVMTSLKGNFKIKMILAPRNQPIRPDWKFLKDGVGALQFSWATRCPGGCRFVKQPTVEITSAKLLIDGSIVQ